MKLKKVRALMAALSLVVGTALCVSTVAWATSIRKSKRNCTWTENRQRNY